MRTQRVLLYSFCLLAAAALPEWAQAVPAQPGFREMAQGDGGRFKAVKWGDESAHGWETDRGHTILFDEKSRVWFYADRSPDGGLMSSGRRVGRDAPPPHLTRKLRPPRGVSKRIDRPLRSAAPPMALSADGASTSPLQQSALRAAPASSVTANVPVILANFSNRTATNTPAEFLSLLFGTGTYSFKDYYQEVSAGSLILSPGPAGIMGWVRLSQTHDYYGTNSKGEDRWPGDVVYESVVGLDPSVDFSPYDGDGDCYVDAVAIIHQGTGEEQLNGLATDIWSHSWALSDAKSWNQSHYGAYTTNDTCTADPSRKVKIDNYIMQPERQDSDMVTVGVFTHEYGHVLGLPDLYDYDYSSEGVGEWSLMSGGAWTSVSRDGDRPSHLDPWSKYLLGWLTPRIVSTAEGAVVLPPVETSSQALQLLSGSPATGGEYFLLENRQKIGFDAALPGEGLLVWHVDESIDTNDNEWYPGCSSCSSHYKVALIQADGAWHLEQSLNSGDSGDPYPGSAGRTTLTSDTLPGNRLYSGAAPGFFLDYIRQTGMDMVTAVGFGAYGIPLNLSVGRSGAVGGMVTSVPAGISCGGICSAAFPFGSRVTLSALAAEGYRFVGWSGACSGSVPCPVILGENTAVTAAFEVAAKALLTIGESTTPHTTLSDAVTTIPAGAVAVIKARDEEFQEDLVIGGERTLVIAGGYDGLFGSASGYSTLRGTVVIGIGSLTVDNLVIR